MPEPTTSSAAAGVAGFKAIGGAAGAAAAGAGLAAIVVMLMTPPRSAREWAVGLICTVLGSICGGAYVLIHFDLVTRLGTMHDNELFVALAALLGLVFACGLPGWAIVRWCFTWMERRKDKDIGEVADDVRRTIGGIVSPPAAPTPKEPQ